MPTRYRRELVIAQGAPDKVAEEQARREAEEQARREAEEHAKREAKEAAQREAEEQAEHEAEQQARREAEEQGGVICDNPRRARAQGRELRTVVRVLYGSGRVTQLRL